tara:strand:- start:70 stop:291 length:222 start_codon:yes stop_codon:yes gene_type:complete
MATTYKKLDNSTAPDGTADGDRWKYQVVEKSITQSPLKSNHTYTWVKQKLEETEARVVELKAELTAIETKAKA